MEAHSANILRKSGRGASREGGYVRAGAGQVEGWVPVRPARMASRWWGAASFPGTGCGGVSGAGRGSGCAASPGGGCRVADRGLGPVCSWSRQGVGMSGVVPRTGGAGSSGSRAGVGPVRAGAGRCGPLGAARAGVDSLFRRGRHGAAAVSERGRSHPRAEPVFRRGPSVPAGQAWSRCRFRTGRSHPPDARPPIFARSALRKGPDAPFSDSFCPFLQRPAAPEPTPFANPRFRRSGKAKKLFFYFYFIIKDVSLCSQNNT